LAPETTEDDLRKEFDMYGRIEKLKLVRDIVTGKSKRYAFILYDREKDMKGAPRLCGLPRRSA
jgi:U1 small nuclear ribonucleoprotein